MRTALLCLVFAGLAYAAGAKLTLDFAVWTAEGARRLRVLQAPVAAPAVQLITPSRGVQSLHKLLGDGNYVTVLALFYTRCPSVCLALGNTLQQLQAALQAQPDSGVQLVSMSFDLAHDDAQTLAAYSRQMKADPEVWQFAAPATDAALRELLTAFGVVVIADGQGGLDHNAALLVINRQRELVRVFDDTDHEAALAFAQHLARGGRAE